MEVHTYIRRWNILLYISTIKCQSESDTGVESVGEFCGVHGDINNVPFGSQSLCFISTSSSPNCVGSDGSIARKKYKWNY